MTTDESPRVRTGGHETAEITTIPDGADIGGEARAQANLDDLLAYLLANDAELRAANLRKTLASIIARSAEPWPDPQEMARIAPDMAERVARMGERVQRFTTAYESALPKPGTGLHVVPGGRS